MLPLSLPIFPVLFLVAVAAFFSATETALFSLSRFQLKQLKVKSPLVFTKVKHLLDRPAALVATVLLGNEVANVATSRLMANFYQSHSFHPYAVTIINLATVLPIILVFGEITPKIIAARSSVAVVSFVIKPFWFIYKSSFPVRFLLESVLNLFTRLLRKKPADIMEENMGEEDFKLLLEDGKKKGVIHSIEKGIIENIFDIDDDNVVEISTPINECFMVSADDTPREIIEKLGSDFFARIPVFDRNRNNVIGILYAKDLLNYLNRTENEMTARNIMKEALFLDPSMRVEVAFRRFRQMKKHIGIVRSKEGQSIGVVTMEDILDQMFGELWEDSK